MKCLCGAHERGDDTGTACSAHQNLSEEAWTRKVMNSVGNEVPVAHMPAVQSDDRNMRVVARDIRVDLSQ